MSDLNTLLITNTGLINVNKKIIEERTYSSKLITKVGNPTVINGVASNFSSENYFTKAPLEFTDSTKIAVNFKGKFFKSDNKQCPFEFITESGSSLPFTFENNRVTLKYKNQEIFSFGGFNFEDEMDITIFLILKTRGYEFTMNYGSSVTQKTGDLNYTLPLSAIKILRLGNSSNNEFWNGEIDLNNFSIYNNGEFLYAPSEGISWNFSHIIVSDGSAHLTDTTEPNDQNIYLFPIKNIARSGSTVLLTSEITEEARLTIKEIGLYVKTPEGTFLFGSIDKLNITKTGELSYNLAFSVNISVGVVNAIGFPAENGIVVKDPDFMEYRDYDTVQQVNTYVLTNLERIIRMNAGAKGKYSYENSAVEENQAGVGHNRPQVVYRLQQELEQMEDCYNSIDTFVKLINRFQEVLQKQANYDSFQIIGDLEVPTNGEVSGFTSSNYIKKETPFVFVYPRYYYYFWNATASFTTSENSEGTVLSMEEIPTVPPSLSVEEIPSSNGTKCKITLSSIATMEPLDAGHSSWGIFYRLPSTFTLEDNTYYEWQYQDYDNFNMYNIHCIGINDALYYRGHVWYPGDSNNFDTLIPHCKVDSANFTFRIRARFGTGRNVQYLVGKGSNENASFEILAENYRLKANLYEKNTGKLITSNLISRYELVPYEWYDIYLSYYNGTYTLSYRTEGTVTHLPYPEEETIHVYSDKQIAIAGQETNYQLVIGNRYADASDRTSMSAYNWDLYSNKDTVLQQYPVTQLAYDFTNHKFIGLHPNGVLFYSTNGNVGTWTAYTPPSIGSFAWKAIACGNGIQLLIRNGGGIARCTGGTEWTTSVIPELSGVTYWDDILYNGEEFIAIGASNHQTYISHSQDGLTWSSAQHIPNLDGISNWKSFAFNGETYILLDRNGYTSTSTNPFSVNSWTSPVAKAELSIKNWSSVISIGTTFVSLNTQGYISTSENGVQWTQATLSEMLSQNSGWSAMAHDSNRVIAIGGNGSVAFTRGESFIGYVDFSSSSLTSSYNIVWQGASNLGNIYTLSPTPQDNDTLYDEEGWEVQGYYAYNYNQSKVPLTEEGSFTFDLLPDTKYDIDIYYKDGEPDMYTGISTYIITSTINNSKSSKKILLKKEIEKQPDLSDLMSVPTNTYVGVKPDTSSPYTGTINLLDYDIKDSFNTWSFSKDVYLVNTELLQCYRMPNLNKNQYTVRDIHNFNRTIRFIENRFEGNDDLIDFSMDRGLTLCVKAHLQDAEPKVILYKSDLMNDVYFSLTFLNQTLAFTLATEQGVMTLSKALTLEEYVSYTNEPIMITVVFTPQTSGWGYLQMFKNNKAITDPTYIKLNSEIDPKIYTLSNYKQEMPTYEVTVDGEVVTKVVEPGRYVSDIVVIEGVISEEDLFYINNLYDTNY